MGNSRNRDRRRKAYEDGVLEADGGVCNRHKYVHDTDLLSAYNQGKAAHTADLKRRAEAEDHPLRQISREAEALGLASGDAAVNEVASLVERMADYLVEQEQMR